MTSWIVIGAGAFAVAGAVTVVAGKAIHDPVTITHMRFLVGERVTLPGCTIVWERTRQGWKVVG